ncbi:MULTISPECIES: divalent-cation tolerance protein CutA [unclassified Comamonas]|uniref:divalent-cation tolerance protein CutA n=1 Tax=unclassified Comamonas TaxID=2638500 RepID=UPI001AD209FE|nr:MULTISPECIES: divalent-cation tolerance protein CutA [unclassified Comamonas]MBN9330392.1 divalent-cation tolerance protein CutA [Comamonas sp.]
MPESQSPTGRAGQGASIAIVTTTVDSAGDADRLAALMVERCLAACVQVQQITAHYRWQAALHRDVEWRLTCKTAMDRVDALLAALAEEHPYDLPQLLVQTARAELRYAQWVNEQTRPPAQSLAGTRASKAASGSSGRPNR